MTTLMGERAVVIGAGVAGLSAAAALTEFFDEVLVLERGDFDGWRAGTPQGWHTHVLLGGGQRALTTLLPGFEQALVDAGAVRIQAGLEFRTERPGFDPFPQRDLGWHTYGMSRQLLEGVIRDLLRRHPSIRIAPRRRVHDILATTDGTSARAVRFRGDDNSLSIATADLIIDASGHGALTRHFLERHGHALPYETSVRADIRYSTVIFRDLPNAPADWKSVTVFPDPNELNMRGVMFPLEHGRWSVSLGAGPQVTLPAELDTFMSCVRTLRTPTIDAALRGAEQVSEVARYAFPVSTRRHFDHMKTFPRGLLPLGDSIVRLNPICAQGMSVAAMESVALQRVLRSFASQQRSLDELAPVFFSEIRQMVETPCLPATRTGALDGSPDEWPADFDMTPQFLAALIRLAAREPAHHKLMVEIQHLLKPRSAYRDRAFMQAIRDELTAMSGSGAP